GSGSASAVIYNQQVIAAVDDGRIYSLDANTGDVQWIAPRPPNVAALDDQRPVAVSGGVLLAGSSTQVLRAYDANTGAPLWNRQPGHSSISSRIGADADYFYVVDDSGYLFVLNKVTGTLVWTTGDISNAVKPFPAVDGNVVYAASIAELSAYNR
ncbi:MAG: PQQ-binding-like beta-propeller repeat protein, partial [Thermoanaerobaculia bacterium]